jgi:general secretion pathway protein G
MTAATSARADLPMRSVPLRPAARRRASSGFTLVEMLVVLAIIGLLIGLVVTNTGGVLGRSEEAVARIFVNDSLKTPLVRYRIDLGTYPSTAEGLAALVAAPNSAGDRWRGPYLEVKGGKIPTDPWGQPYEYRFPGTKNPGGYDVFSKGPDRIADTADDIGNW